MRAPTLMLLTCAACLQTVPQSPLGFRCDTSADCGDAGTCFQGICQGCIPCDGGETCQGGCVQACMSGSTHACPNYCGLQVCGPDGGWSACPTSCPSCPCFCGLDAGTAGKWCGLSAIAKAEATPCALPTAVGNENNLLLCLNNVWSVASTCPNGCKWIPDCVTPDQCN